MKLELNKKEYLLLLHVLEMSDWVLNAHTNKEDTEHKDYGDLEQKIFSLAQDFGYGSLIEYSAETERFMPTRQYEDTRSVMELIQQFENDTFWDELIDRLAERDALREVGEKAFQHMKPIDRIMLIERYRDKYAGEFEKDGIERISLAQPDNAPDGLQE
jgi:hypothetical protein